MGMKWLWLLLAIILPGGMIMYAIGCWLLGQWPTHFWKEAQPDMYDGKEPYEQWAAKMELARRLQAHEEAVQLRNHRDCGCVYCVGDGNK